VELRITFQDQGAFVVFHHPFHHLAFLDLQGLSPGSRAEILAVLAAPLNHLHGGLITHLGLLNPDWAARPPIIAIELVKHFFRFFHTFSGGERKLKFALLHPSPLWGEAPGVRGMLSP
jgi:hypothetical protein